MHIAINLLYWLKYDNKVQFDISFSEISIFVLKKHGKTKLSVTSETR